MKRIDAFILFTNPEQGAGTVKELKQSHSIKQIFLLTPKGIEGGINGCINIPINNVQSSDTVKSIAQHSSADYTLIYLKPTLLHPGYFALERMMQIADDSGAGMVYSDYRAIIDGVKSNHPVISYQEGSLRDDFNFGSLLLYNTLALKEAAQKMSNKQYQYAGIYDLRLKVSVKHPLVHINEYLYSEIEEDTRASGEKIFDYVDPKNRERQVEMEQVCTDHLKEIGAWLPLLLSLLPLTEMIFPLKHRLLYSSETESGPYAMPLGRP